MIDIEDMIISMLSDALDGIANVTTDVSPNADIDLPALTVEEIDNYPVSDDGRNEEQYAQIVYEMNAYSNKAYGRKREVKNIISIVDQKMRNLNFVRISQQSLENSTNVTKAGSIDYHDTSIYRMVVQYRAVVSKEKNGKYTFYRNYRR